MTAVSAGWADFFVMSEGAMEPVEDFTKVESVFVRQRNCLLVRGQFTPVFTGYYLHLMEHGLRYETKMDATLKDMLAVLTLHLTARPWAETIAWTANLRAPRVNYFVTGSSTFENITGRLFTKDIREPDRNQPDDCFRGKTPHHHGGCGDWRSDRVAGAVLRPE